jgi:hypothetical protein
MHRGNICLPADCIIMLLLIALDVVIVKHPRLPHMADLKSAESIWLLRCQKSSHPNDTGEQ